LKKIIKYLLVIASTFFACILLISYTAVYINPTDFVLPSIFGTIFPALFVINLAFVAIFIFKRKWFVLISLIALVPSYKHFDDFISFGAPKEKLPKKLIRVMSYNVRMFDFFKWEGSENADSRIYNLISQRKPDILCLQEFYSCAADSFSSVDSICRKAQFPYYSVAWKKVKKNKTKLFGTAIFSRFPIVKTGNVMFEDSLRKGIFADLKINNDTIRVYSIHLASVHLNKNDYQFLDKFAEKETSGYTDHAWGIVSKMMQAYRNRAFEADVLAVHARLSPYPVMICGDLNDTPLSYSYHKVRGTLNDSFSDCGLGFGSTYVRRFSLFRIDCIFHGKKIKTHRFETISEKHSDHYPVEAELEIL
jgi:endonuclease/exonuclease/phosphatase family metal-dependent hydrolase